MGWRDAVEGASRAEVDYAMLVKSRGQAPEGEKRYRQAECIGTEKHMIQGNPDPKLVSTSYLGRQNLTLRTCIRRFIRLALALYFMYYNFARPHKTLANPYPRTPGMAAGISNHIGTVEEIVRLV